MITQIAGCMSCSLYTVYTIGLHFLTKNLNGLTVAEIRGVIGVIYSPSPHRILGVNAPPPLE